MPIHTLNPDETATVGQWATDQGSTSLHPRLAIETGYVRPSTTGQWLTSSFLSYWFVGFEDLPVAAMPAGARIFAVRWVWARTVFGAGTAELRTRLHHGGASVVADVWSDEDATVRFHTEPWRTTKPGSSDGWGQFDVALLQVSGSAKRQGASGNITARFHRVYLEVDVNLRPYVDVTGPAEEEEITDTAQPTISWDYFDPEGDEQAAYRIRVGSNPEFIPGAIVYDSGWISSAAARSHQIPVPLDNGEYGAHVQVRQQWAGAGDGPVSQPAGARAGNGNPGETGQPDVKFTINVQGPEAPTLTATPDPAEARIEVEVIPDGGTVETSWVDIDYRDTPGSGPWHPLRGGQEVVPDPDVVVYDYEARFGVEREYRARPVVDLESGPIPGDSATDTATLEYVRPAAWITDVRDPALLNVPVEPTETRERTWHGLEVAHHPADLGISVVESEPPWRSDLVTFIAADQAAHDALEAAFGSGRTYLYRDDRREHLYFRWLGDRTRVQIGPRIFDADTFEGLMVEVARPPV